MAWLNSVPVVRHDLDTGEKWASLDAVASVCGVRSASVETWIERGWLYAAWDLGRWLVPLRDLALFIERGHFVFAPRQPKREA